MCGIIGYVGDRAAGPIVHEGLFNLEYRGYDSVGVALRNGELTVAKRAGEVAALDPPHRPNATCGIGHTRWSTHGPPTDANAHPHTDCTDRVAVVHNGIIENHVELRDDLSDHTFTSETDTEVVPHLLEEALADGASLLEAVEGLADRLDGGYAICALAADAEEIVATRRRSPLVLGLADHGQFIASDVPAFLHHTRDVVFLEDGQIAQLSPEGVSVHADGASVEPTVETVSWDAEAAEKGGYAHYMRKEIHEQPTALRQTLAERLDYDDGGAHLDLALPVAPRALEEVQFVGAGTSAYASMYGARLLEELADLRTTVSIASEYDVGGGRDPDRTLCIAVTQSGETADTLGAVRAAAIAGMPTLAVTNTLGSTVTRETDDTVYIKAGPEIGVAATKTFASQVATLTMLGVHLGRARATISPARSRAIIDDLANIPGAVQQALDREGRLEALARAHLGSDSYFFIGRRLGYPVALEGALKLKEIAYDHAEAFPAGELKHGPLALVTRDTPVIAVLTKRSNPAETLHNVAEAQARGAPTIGLVDVGLETDQLDETIDVPSLGYAAPLVANVYLQLFAYHTANLQGRPIDKPRNLAKSVTVE